MTPKSFVANDFNYSPFRFRRSPMNLARRSVELNMLPRVYPTRYLPYPVPVLLTDPRQTRQIAAFNTLPGMPDSDTRLLHLEARSMM
jgi:hypothetical protein